jgi:hypothetical protein
VITFPIARKVPVQWDCSELGVLPCSRPHAQRAPEALLPEDKRKKYVATVAEYAVEGQDLLDLENPYVRGVFTEEEFEEMLPPG